MKVRTQNHLTHVLGTICMTLTESEGSRKAAHELDLTREYILRTNDVLPKVGDLLPTHRTTLSMMFDVSLPRKIVLSLLVGVSIFRLAKFLSKPNRASSRRPGPRASWFVAFASYPNKLPVRASNAAYTYLNLDVHRNAHDKHITTQRLKSLRNA
jgi:hypothetical protein